MSKKTRIMILAGLTLILAGVLALIFFADKAYMHGQNLLADLDKHMEDLERFQRMYSSDEMQLENRKARFEKVRDGFFEIYDEKGVRALDLPICKYWEDLIRTTGFKIMKCKAPGSGWAYITMRGPNKSKGALYRSVESGLRPIRIRACLVSPLENDSIKITLIFKDSYKYPNTRYSFEDAPQYIVDSFNIPSLSFRKQSLVNKLEQVREMEKSVKTLGQSALLSNTYKQLTSMLIVLIHRENHPDKKPFDLEKMERNGSEIYSK